MLNMDGFQNNALYRIVVLGLSFPLTGRAIVMKPAVDFMIMAVDQYQTGCEQVDREEYNADDL